MPGKQPAATELPLWEPQLPVLVESIPVPGGGLGPATFEVLSPEADLAQAAAGDDLRDARLEVLERARAEAEAVVAAAYEEAGAVREAARREGLEGYAADQVEAFRGVVEVIRGELLSDLAARWRELELEAARLCVGLAENVVRRVVAEDDQVVVDTVREGLARIPAARSVTVYVSPECQEAVAAAAPGLAQELAYGVTLEVRGDPNVTAGGALLQSSNGEVDLQLETQIARLREAAVAAILREADSEAES